MPEYREHRCCLCQNIDNPQSAMCPLDRMMQALGQTSNKPCRFVKTYMDERGWLYKVMGGLGESNFKARYQKPEKKDGVGWKCIGYLPWRKSFDEAQSDLNALAKSKGWNEHRDDEQ